jgi:hypothetical protein
MEIEILVSAIEQTISYLRKSQSPDPSQMPIEEIIRRLEAGEELEANGCKLPIVYLPQ